MSAASFARSLLGLDDRAEAPVSPGAAGRRNMLLLIQLRWLAVAGQLSGHLTLHALDPHTGRLTPHARHATGDDPICVEIASL